MIAIIKKFLILNIIYFQLLIYISCLNVQIHKFDGVEIEPFNSQVYKREMTQFFDKASYSFNGFQRVESIPVIFPIDICILKLESSKYATSLYRHQTGERHFVVFKMNNGSYDTIADIRTPNAIAMDCIGVGKKGFIAIAFNYSTPVENAPEGSPVYLLEEDRLRAVQYFSDANLYNVYIRAQGSKIILLQTFQNTKLIQNLHCPYFSWSESTFNRIGHIPCSNARHLEPFSIDHEIYVAVANYADQHGRTSTYSEIYKFMKKKKNFELFQKIKTNGAVDVRFFRVPIDEFQRKYFLLFGNSIGKTDGYYEDNNLKNLEASSVFYVYEKGQFVPYQSLTVYALDQFLPIQNVDSEKFLLLVSSKNQDTKIYNFNDWKFEESKAQYTEGALGKGVSNMRIFQDQDQSYLVIANERMFANETNIFLPIFKQEEHANALRQQIIEWSKENLERLGHINVDKLKNDVERKLLLQQNVVLNETVNEIPTANIKTVITQSLINPKLRMNSKYWKVLDYTNRALNALESEHISADQRQKRNTEENLYNFEHIEVGTLNVKKKLSAKYINGIDYNNPHLESINAKEIVVTERYIGPEKEGYTKDIRNVLSVDNLTIKGNLNGRSWHEIFNNTLKIEGSQFIKSNLSLGKLKTEYLFIKNNRLNDMSLDKIVQINNGSYIVSQDVLFGAPVYAKKVIIKDRLNQIPINQQKLDVLLKRSNETQLVTGQKRLNNLRVLKPITMAGSFWSDHFRAISPNKAIHNNLVLQGDYIINGDVIITKLLNIDDLMDLQSNTSIKKLLSNALHIDVPLDDVNMMFTSAIKANNSIVSFINTKDMQQLVKTNTSFPQILRGLKTFKNGLNIQNGSSDVKILNGFDMENLEKKLLLKDTNQTIQAPIRLKRILARSIQSANLTLDNKNVQRFLTKSGNQHINGDLKVEGLEVETLLVENLNTNGKLFYQKLTEIYETKTKVQLKVDIFENDRKYLGNIHVKNLEINSTLNEKTITDIEDFLLKLNGNIKYVGNYNSNYIMNIENLTFEGHFNGINSNDFGNCWLRKTGEQIFTAPQTFDSVTFEKGAILTGKLNGYFLRDFLENTYFTDRNEFIKNAIFLNPVKLQMPLKTKTLNKLHVPDDMLHRKIQQVHIFQAPISIRGDLKIQGSILNVTFLNNINLKELIRFLREPQMKNTLHLENANFNYVPIFQTLNKHDLRKTLNQIWLTNENIDLATDVEIFEAYFEGLLDFEGPVNNINLKYLKENYLSKSKQQIIRTEVVFRKNVTFESDVEVEETNLMGPIAEHKSFRTLNFNTFVTNSLKKTGQQKIYGNWTIAAALISDDVQNVVVNNLNLATDVVRLDANNIVTVEKRIHGASMEKIYAKDGSTINNVDVSNWMQHAAYAYKNQTISGCTTLSNANIDDIKVYGYVNDKVFDEHHLLLTDQKQTVHGKYTFRNKLSKEQRILSNNIKNLYTEKINGFEVNKFLKNLTAEYLNENAKGNLKSKRNILDSGIAEKEQTIYNLEKITHDLSSALKDTEGVLYDFGMLQVLLENATKLVPITVQIANENITVLGLINESNLQDTVKFYYFNPNEKLFVPNERNLSWLPQDRFQFEMMVLIFGVEYITLQRPQKIYKENITSDENFKEMIEISHNGKFIEPLKYAGKECFAVYGSNTIKSILIYCLSANNFLLKLNKEYEIKKHAQKIIALPSSQFAILSENTIEIWNNSKKMNLHQVLKTNSRAILMAKGEIDGTTYLAIVTENKINGRLNAAVEIYSRKRSNFEHRQTLDLDVEPQQIAFSSLTTSQDLLLYLRTNNTETPLLVYQLKGVMQFQPIDDPKTLGPAHYMQILTFDMINKHLIIWFEAESKISIVELKFKML